MASILIRLSPGRPRTLNPIGTAISHAICLGMGALYLAIASGVYVDPGITLYVFLGGVLSLAFLHRTGNPLRPTKLSVPGATGALLSSLGCAYLIFEQDRLSDRLPVIDPINSIDLLVGCLLVILVLEATRRCIGMTLVTLVSGFLVYGFMGDRIEGPFYHRGLSLPEIIEHLVYTSEGLFGPALEVAALLVFVFVMFGALFDRFGGGEFFHQLAQSLVGRQTGGTAKVAVLSSALYGSVSGSPTADVVTTGSFTIPLMIKTGFSKVRASAIEATASTGGSILPPVMGSAAFLMSDFTGIPYSEIVVAAIMPAFFYYFSVYMAVHHYAHRHQLNVPSGVALPSLWQTLRQHWVYLIPLVTIAWAVLNLNRPSLAGALACLAVIPAMFHASRPSAIPTKVALGLIDGVQRMVLVGVACAVAGLVIGTLSITDLTGKLSSVMFAMASGSYIWTVVTAMTVIIALGMGMPVPAVYALGAVLAAPALTALGADLMAAHLFIVYFAAMSAITPPVAVAAFAAASISGSNPMAIGVVACRIGIVAFIIPLVFLNTPQILLVGSPGSIAVVFVTTLVACWALSSVTEGYLAGPLNIISRFMLLIASIAVLIATGWLSVMASAIIIMIAYAQWRNHRSASNESIQKEPGVDVTPD